MARLLVVGDIVKLCWVRRERMRRVERVESRSGEGEVRRELELEL
jgi:hypothetical protein